MSAPRSSTTVAAVSRSHSKAALRRACKPVFEGLENRQMLAVDPVMVYSFNEGSGGTVADTGVGDAVNNSGTLVASTAGSLPEWRSDAPSPSGGSYLRFNGTRFAADGTTIDTSLNEGGRVDLVNSLAPVLGSTSSLAYWIRLAEGVRGQGSPWDNPSVTGAEQAAGGNDIFYGNVNGSGSVLAKAGDGAEATSRPINDGTWHHVVHTYDHTSGQLRTYVDGSLHSSVNSQTGPKTQPFNSLGALVLRSNDLATVAGYNYLNGDLDQVEAYDRALTPQEVATRYGPTATAAPAAPVVTANTDRVRAVTLNFNDVAGAVGYRVLRSTTGAAGSFTEVAVLGNNASTPTESFTQTNLTAGQQYHYQVIAFNGAGESAASQTVVATPAATGQGLVGNYYNSNFWGSTARPADTNSFVIGNPNVREAIGNSVNFNWPDGGTQGTNSPHPSIRTNDFSTAYAGKLVAPETGLYTILGYGDDDTHVFVNGILVSSDPGGHGVPGNDEGGYNAIDSKTSIELVAGQQYDILVLQAEGGGGAGVILRWVTPSRQLPGGGYVQPATIPVTALQTGSRPLTAPTNLSVSGGNGWHQVDITFTERNTGEVRYVLERSLNNGPFQVIRNAPIVPNSWDGTAGGFTDGSGFIQDLVSVPGTYTYRLRAENFDGAGPAATTTLVVNAATPPLAPNPDPTVPAGTGAQGYYFNTQYWGTNTAPAANQISINAVPIYTENVGDIVENWGDNGPNGMTADPGGDTNPNNTFSTVYTGTLTAPATGEYQILGFSDDDSYVWVNGQLVSADPGGHGIPGNDAGGIASIDVRNPITLTAGQKYNFVAIQSEGGGGAGIILRWSLPGTTNFVDIPVTAFSGNLPNAAGAQPNGAPLAPTNVRVDEGDRQATYVIVRWADNATNELRYTIERTNVATGEVTRFAAPINATSYIDSTTAPNTQYTYRVLAGNFVDVAAGSVNVTTLAANTPPSAPTNVIATARNTPSVIFRDASLNETQFVIERATVTGGVVGSYAEVARINGSANGVQGGTFRFNDTTAGVAAGTTYSYRVVAVNPGGPSAPSAASQVTFTPRGGTGVTGTYYNREDFTNEGGAPLVINPTDLEDVYGDGGPAGLTADSGNTNPNDTFSSLLQGYIVPEFSERYTFRMSSDDGLGLQLIDPETGELLINYNNLGRAGGVANGFEFDTGSADLVAGKRYALIVRQREATGGAGYRVGWESASLPLEVIPVDVLFPVSATDALVPGSITSVQPVGAEQINLTLNPNLANFTETGYQVLRSTTGAPGSFNVIATLGPDATSYVDNQGIVAGQTYYYQIRVIRNAEQGPLSPTASATVTVGGSGVTIGGTAAVLPGGVLQLTDNVNDRRGTAFTTNAQQVVTAGQGPAGSAGFQTSFNFTIPEGSLNAEGQPNMADGFAFVIQRNNPTAMGNGGGGLAYVGMPNSLAVEFDLYNNQNEVGVYFNGANLLADDANGNSTDTGLVFGNGHEYRVDLKYNADTDTMELTITDLTDNTVAPFTTTFTTARTGNDAATSRDEILDIPTLIGGGQAFFGFTGATGGLNADQRISNWTINGQAVAFVPPVTRKPGDADGDGDVDGVDMGKWGQNFTGSLAPGTGGKTVEQGDFDGDGDVDGNDAAIWGQNFTGELGGGVLTASAPAVAPAPKPVVSPVTAPLLPASPTTAPVATPVAAPVATPAATPIAKPASKPVTTPVAKPVVKPVVTKPAAKPIVKPAAKPAVKPAAMTKPAATRSPALASVFSSKKIGAAKPSVLGSAGSVLK